MSTLKHYAHRSLVMGLLITQAMPAMAVVPPLSNSPLNQTSLVEPNLLFVYDTSGSMAWSHVPDHAGLGGDTLSGTNVIPGTVGYKNALCNTLAFNPLIDYQPPLQANGTSMADANFSAAPYDGLRPTLSSGTNTASMPFSTYGTTINLGTRYFGWDFAEANIGNAAFRRGNDNAGNPLNTAGTNLGTIPSSRTSSSTPATPRVTRTGTSPNWTIRVDTGGTSHNVALNDLVVVHSPASVAGVYRATASVNTGSTRYFTFDITSTTAPPSTSPSVDWYIREAGAGQLYVFGSASPYTAYWVTNGIQALMMGGHNKIDISTNGSNQYNGTYNFSEVNFVDGFDGYGKFQVSSNFVPGNTADNVGQATQAMELPTTAHYYAFTGTGTAPASYTDTRCKEMPSVSSGVLGNSTNFTRVDIPLTGTAPTNTRFKDPITGTDVSMAADELRRRFANWFSYYRRRSMLMKTAVSSAFGSVDADFRVGFMTIHATPAQITNAGGSTFRAVKKFDTAARTTWYSTLFAASDGLGGTPLREALSGAGRYFGNKYASTVDDPMYASAAGGQCQRNFTILSTDGQWNNTNTNPIGCNTCTATLTGTPADNTDLIGEIDASTGPAGFATYRARSDGVLDGKARAGTLADVALYYYGQDIRPDLSDNYGTIPAPFQNMVTHTIGLGLSGRLAFDPGYRTATSGDFYRIKQGVATCAAVGGGTGTSTCDWPDPGSDGPQRVDDLWHAAVNGRGTFFSAKDPNSLSQGLATAINDLRSSIFKAVAPTTASPVLSDATNVSYVASYKNGAWTGRLEAKLVNPATGEFLPGDPIWRAHQKLDAQVLNGGAGDGWDTQRKIAVGKGDGTATPFRWASLTTAQQNIFKDGKDTTFGQNMVAYLRGDRTHEGDNGLKQFRARGDDVTGDTTLGILGDIVNSRPVVVDAVGSRYSNDYHSGYNAFKTSIASRTPVVYVGANDGMLHAFDASSTGTGATRTATSASGKELWAYIPSMLVRSTTDEDGRKDGLQSYAYRSGGNPPFRKHYFADGTPTVFDADLGHTGGVKGTPDWRTLLISGLNKGGKGYYALDVTNGASAADESAVANKLLWEFTGDADMGYSFGSATVTWHRVYGWVVIVPSGYNNSTGNGAIWVLNAKTGAVIKKFSITSSSCGATRGCQQLTGISGSNPLNLGGLTTFVTSRDEERLWSIYAVDMQGNVWRADASDDNAANWDLTKLATLDPGALTGVYGTTRQSVTTNPTVAWDPTVDARWVFVGTGLDQSRDDRDGTKNQANQVQTMYAIRDGQALTPLTSGLPVTRADLVPVNRDDVDAVTMPSNKRGWYMDLAPSQTVLGVDNLAERIVLQPSAALGLVVFATSIPTKDVCSPGNSGRVFARSYLSGKEGKSYVQETDGSGNTVTVASVNVAKGAAANPRLVQLSSGKIVLQTADVLGGVTNVGLEGADPTLRARTSWRELITE